MDVSRFSENIQNKIKNIENRHGDTLKKSKEGVVFTPKNIVDYMVKYSLDMKIDKYDMTNINTFRILDPCVGCGAFPIGIFDYLCDWKLKKQGFLSFHDKCNIIFFNMTGIDIDKESIHITKLVLIELVMKDEPSCEKTEQLIYHILSYNFIVGDALLIPPKMKRENSLFDQEEDDFLKERREKFIKRQADILILYNKLHLI